MKLIKFIFTCLLFAFLFSCQEQTITNAVNESDVIGLAEEELNFGTSDSDTYNVIRDVGQVKFIDLEGGFWGIAGSKGNYKPLNLSREYCQEGLWVIFTAESVDVPTITMWGESIKIIRIEKVKDKIITDTGIIKQSGIQGRPWLIEGIKATYQPINLPAEFQKEGLLVKFSAFLKTGVIIIPNIWPVIEILKIEKVTDPILVKLEEEFKLPVKFSAYQPDERILMAFDGVVSDSRCPEGAMSFWEGEAVILVTVSIKSVNYGQFKLSTLSGKSAITVGGFKFTLNDLYPYPRIDDSVIKEYVGYFTIEKAMHTL